MEVAKGVQRWLVNISEWNPSPHEFSLAMSSLPQHQHSSITRFVKMADQKRAFVSRLLQYTFVHEVLGIPFDEIIIQRTLEGKPFLEYNKVNEGFPNFNFNVSHHGDYVAIASEPICIVGLDIVSHTTPEKETVPEFIQSFASYFSSVEWENIVNAGTCDEMLNEFYRYWCVKEAFVKAIGTGVGYKLDHLEFHHKNWTNIHVEIDGKEMKDWKFWLSNLGRSHSISIARGHPRNAAENYKKTLKQIQFDEEEYQFGLHLPNVSFMFRTVEELISVSSRAQEIRLNVSK